MKIRLIGKELTNRWTVEINDKLISLNGCDFLILLSLAIVWSVDKDNWLNKDLLCGHNTSRYVWRLKSHIYQLTDIDARRMIINTYEYKSTGKGNYKLFNVDEVIIEPLALRFYDKRLGAVLKYTEKENNMRVYKEVDDFALKMMGVLTEKQKEKESTTTWQDPDGCDCDGLLVNSIKHQNEMIKLLGKKELSDADKKRIQRISIHVANRQMMIYDRISKGLK